MRSITGLIIFVSVITISLNVIAMDSSLKVKKNDLSKGYALSIKYCTSCHDSVADPEKTGYTRDTWFVIINIMHKQGMEIISEEDTSMLVDYFYSIRRGIEREAG